MVIRCKNNSNILGDLIKINKNNKNKKLITDLYNKTRRITSLYTQKKVVKNKDGLEKTIEKKCECTVITNLMDANIFSDENILKIYKLRWDVDVYIKYIKNNFKCEYLTEKKEINYQKMYFCEMILTYISRILIYKKLKKTNSSNFIKKRISIPVEAVKKRGRKSNAQKKREEEIKNNVLVACKITINESNLIGGIFTDLLDDIFENNLTQAKLDNFCKSYIIINKNELNREFERKAISPCKKWYIKALAELSRYKKIIDAIENNTLHKLKGKLKTDAKKIKIVIDFDHKNG